MLGYLTMRSKQAHAAIYARISDDREGSGLGVARQEHDCRELCARRGFDVVEVLIDNDMSAYRSKPRPGYRQLVDLVKAGTIEVIVVWHNDRLTRSPRELEDLIDFVEATGVTIATVTAGDYDLSTPTGRMVARIVGATARQESEHKSERNRRKARELAEAGKLTGGGTRPFGYDDDRITIREDEAELIREAIGKVLDGGEGIRAIARDWHDRGIVTPTGKTWKLGPLRRLLRSARISGRKEHHGVIVGPAIWPAIITPARSDRVRAILGITRARRVPRKYLLTGLAVCGRCGTKLVARPRQNGTRCYVCPGRPDPGCGKIRVLAEPLEALVAETTIVALDTPQLARAIAGAPSPAAGELQALRDQEGELARMWARREISRESWQVATAELSKQLDELRGLLDVEARHRVTADLVGGGALRERWPGLGFDQRRLVLETVIETVTVGPGRPGYNRFDPGRVDVVWRV
jgi:site-specific DNA recombinase